MYIIYKRLGPQFRFKGVKYQRDLESRKSEWVTSHWTVKHLKIHLTQAIINPQWINNDAFWQIRSKNILSKFYGEAFYCLFHILSRQKREKQMRISNLSHTSSPHEDPPCSLIILLAFKWDHKHLRNYTLSTLIQVLLHLLLFGIVTLI